MPGFPNARSLIVATVDFPSFLEADIGLDLQWKGDRSSCMCLCPLHGDTNRSFSVKQHPDGWGFHCFGCQAGGTVVEFFMQYYGLDHDEALASICERFDIDTDGLNLIQEALKVPVLNYGESDEFKKLAAIHKTAATQCRFMLRKRPDDGALKKWVASAYERMNECIDNTDLEGMERILTEAFQWNA